MRYKSPPGLPQEKQKTIQERVALQHRERQAELRSTPDNDARRLAHCAKVLEERAKRGDSMSTPEEVNRTVTQWLFPLPAVKK